MDFRTRFHRVRVAITFPEVGRTKSEFADDADINKIVAKYRKTGILPHAARAAAMRFGDFSQVPDYMQMQEKIIAANDLFSSLPAAVRKQYDNNPGKFLEAAETKEGRELMVKLGLDPFVSGSPVENPVSAPGKEPSSSPASAAGQAAKAGTEPASGAKAPGSSSESVNK